MESSDVVNTTKPSSAKEENEIKENRLSNKELFICKSRQKIQLLENIQAAELKYEAVKMQLDFMKPQRHGNKHNEIEIFPQKSNLSFNSSKSTTSERTTQNENVEDNANFGKNHKENIPDDIRTDQVQIILTPRSQKTDIKSYETVPNLGIRMEESPKSDKTNKLSKKTFKLKKKSHVNRVNGEPLRASLIYAAKSKRKKFHERLKNSNSRSTVATRETNFSDKKTDRKKFRRQKSLDSVSLFQTSCLGKRINSLKRRESKQVNSKNFIEIYHNTTLKSEKSSNASNRHSKIESMHNPHSKEETLQARGDNKSKKNAQISEHNLENTSYIESQNFENGSNKFKKNDEECQEYEKNVAIRSSDFYNPFYQRKYEMPTMASKMKCVDRPLFHRFNIRNIPFVVGTSISPSHNLGLNIQQILSMIKTKQPALPEVSPLLIQKVSKGIRPVSSLFEHINGNIKSFRNLHNYDCKHIRKSNLELNKESSSFSCERFENNKSASFMSNHIPFRQNITCEPLYEEDEQSHSTYSDSRAKNEILQKKLNICESRLEMDRNTSEVYLQARRNNLKQPKKYGSQLSEIIIGDSDNQLNYLNNNNELQQVFTRFYEEYDKMLTQQEKLKKELEKRKDKSLVKEISEMEASIKIKDQEITAIVNLYKEVLYLKQQMKLLHERNSFVCITENSAFRQVPKLKNFQAHNSEFKYHYNRASTNVHATSNSFRLAGLLKQIQAFQRQLALT